jgi:hypothetical protein
MLANFFWNESKCRLIRMKPNGDKEGEFRERKGR